MPAPDRRSRRGFTLVELLVVVTILAILIALLLPAVQAAREAARRAQCVNNLKQMGLGLHNYHDVYQCFPGGTTSYPAPWPQSSKDYGSGINWAVAILPFLEQETLYRQYDSNVTFDNNSVVIATRLEVQLCPSDINDIGAPPEVPNSGPAVTMAHGSYKAVGGAYDPGNINNFFWDNCFDAAKYSLRYRGVLHHAGGNCRTALYESLGTIIDGTSNTLMVGEASYFNPRTRSVFWASGYACYAVGAVNNYPAQFSHDFTNKPCNADNYCKRAFNSYHPGGQNFVFCDGTCRFVSTSIDLVSIYPALATIAGGEVVTVPE